MKSTINTDQYTAAHGRRPQGYGKWVFEIKWIKTPFWPDVTSSKVFMTGTYTAAKADALKEVKRCAGMSLKASSISLLS